MKICKHITCWTDYPVVELGDIAGEKAPIRRVNVISYDGNKYARVSVEGNGDVLYVKRGYLYSQPGRCGEVKTVSRRKLERMGDGRVARMVDFWTRASARSDRQFEEKLRQEARMEVHHA